MQGVSSPDLGVPSAKETIQKGAAIAGNVATTITVPAGERWLLLNVMMELTTDVTVANRTCRVTTQDIANVLKFRNAASVITASLTQARFFSKGLVDTAAIYNGLGMQVMEEGEDVVLDVLNGVAGDAYDYLVEYLVTKV